MPRPSIGPKLFWAGPNLFGPDQNVSHHNLNVLIEIEVCKFLTKSGTF